MPEILKTNYTHDALIDAILANPEMTQRQFAGIFGYSETWLSIVMNSDAFKEKLVERREEVVDPILKATIQDRLNAVANKSLDNILQSMHDKPADMKTATKALELTTRALGFGAKTAPTVQLTIQPVAVVPAKSISSDDWMQSFNPTTRAAEAVTFDHQEASHDSSNFDV